MSLYKTNKKAQQAQPGAAASEKVAIVEMSSEESSKYPDYPLMRTVFNAREFIFGGGVVIFHRSTNRVVVVQDKRDPNGLFLPKGRVDVGETIAFAAAREGTEESGYPCRLLPVFVRTQQPDQRKSGEVHLSTESFYNHVSPKKYNDLWPNGGIYYKFYYVAEVTDEEVEQVEKNKAKKVNLKKKKEKEELKGKKKGLTNSSAIMPCDWTEWINESADDAMAAAADSIVKQKVLQGNSHEIHYEANLYTFDEARELVTFKWEKDMFEDAVALVEELDQYEEELEEKAAKKKKAVKGKKK